MMTLDQNPFFARLADSQRVLIAGAGGGFDVYAGLPLALTLAALGKDVTLANLSFTPLAQTTAEWAAPHLAKVSPETEGSDGYFPERTLARWLAKQDIAWPIYAFERVGVQPLSAAYQALTALTDVDAIVLVDGGTDILMFGDEFGLGTPQEDMASLAAVASLSVPTRLVACLGFGIDAYHGVCHAHFLENVATLDRDGSYFGAFSLPGSSREGRLYADAVADAQAATPQRPSIVNGSIAAAVAGRFGDVQFTRRTSNSQLFINPLMTLYFTFDLPGMVTRSLYLAALAETKTMRDMTLAIEAFRHTVERRPFTPFPH